MTVNHFVYIVECADGSLYTGYATDVDKRLLEHNGEAKGKLGAKYTRGRRPVKLRFAEQYLTRSAALKREHEIKQLSRTQKYALINNQTLS